MKRNGEVGVFGQTFTCFCKLIVDHAAGNSIEVGFEHQTFEAGVANERAKGRGAAQLQYFRDKMGMLRRLLSSDNGEALGIKWSCISLLCNRFRRVSHGRKIVGPIGASRWSWRSGLPGLPIVVLPVAAVVHHAYTNSKYPRVSTKSKPTFFETFQTKRNHILCSRRDADIL